MPSSLVVAHSSLTGSHATPVTDALCDRDKVRYACVGTSNVPMLPVDVAATIWRPSEDTHADVTGASCSASRKKSEKSVGQTRGAAGSRPVVVAAVI